MNPFRTVPASLTRQKPIVYVRAKDTKFSVLRLAPQYPAGPEFVVCAGSNAVAHFFEEADARDYAAIRCHHPEESVQLLAGTGWQWCSRCGSIYHPGPGAKWESPNARGEQPVPTAKK